MRLSASPAATGSREEDGDHEQRRAGQDPRGRAALGHACLLPQPAALLEHRVDPGVELPACRFGILSALHDALGGELHLLEDSLPLGDLGRGAHPLELLRERLRGRVVRERRRVPGAAPRRQVAGERMEALHRRRLAQEADQFPGSVLSSRTLEHDEARPAGRRHARPVRARQRRSGPVVLPFDGKSTPELADVPGTGDVEDEQAAREFVPDVRYLRARDSRREIVAKQARVEVERAPERRLARRRRGCRCRRAPVLAAATGRTADRAR